MGRAPGERVSRGRILRDLRQASRRGDRAALTVAIEGMRMLALTPRYWEKYLDLLDHPLARLVDLLVIKQGERIADQRRWKRPRPPADTRPADRGGDRDRPAGRPASRTGSRAPDRHPPRGPVPAAAGEQRLLFDDAGTGAALPASRAAPASHRRVVRPRGQTRRRRRPAARR